MPDQALWLHRIPAILTQLRDFPAPVVDRFTIEQLFSLSRRQAIRVMHRFGGYQVGRTFVVERGELIRRLELVAGGSAVDQARNRKRRIWHELTEHRNRVKAMAVKIPQPAAVSGVPALAALPDGVRLERGRLEIRFDGPEELLQRLYSLSQALAEEYESFAANYYGPPAV